MPNETDPTTIAQKVIGFYRAGKLPIRIDMDKGDRNLRSAIARQLQHRSIPIQQSSDPDGGVWFYVPDKFTFVRRRNGKPSRR